MLEQDYDECDFIEVYHKARKVFFLRDLAHTNNDNQAALADLKKKLSTLSKLEIL